jgi:[protein-PII] uridylyltransferase
VRAAGEHLLDVRDQLQLRAGRPDDVLRQQDYAGVAQALGLLDADGQPDRDAALRQVNSAARVVAHAADVTWRRAEAAIRPPRRWRVGGRAMAPDRAGPDRVGPDRVGPDRVGLAADVVSQGGEIMLARDATPATDPGLVLRVARAAAEHDRPVAAFTLDRLAAEAAPLPGPWPARARDDFIALLGAGPAAVQVMEAFDLAGLLDRLIPEWAAVRCKAQHNPVHRFTVDRHLIETAAQAASHARQVSRPDLLLVGALLHDIGKGFSGDHSITGAERTAVIVRRMGFDQADTATVTALVRHHLLLPDTATRRDLDDPRTVEAVADAVGGSAPLLDLLHVLTIADAAATGPAAWSDWKAGLIAELVRRTHAVLRGGPVPLSEPLSEELRTLAAPGRLVLEIRGDEVIVAAPDRVGVLYRTAGVLALHSLDVRSASIRTHAGMAINSFVVSPRFGRMPDPLLVRADLARALDGELALAQRLRDKERSYGDSAVPRRPPDVSWVDDAATAATVLEIRAEDAIGLLCRLTAALERCQLDVRSALVSSLGASVVDVFYVTTRDGRPVPLADRADIEAELRRA